MRTLDSDKKEIEKFTMLRYLKLPVCWSDRAQFFELLFQKSTRSLLIKWTGVLS